jgi:hypothetical protein
MKTNRHGFFAPGATYQPLARTSGPTVFTAAVDYKNR